MKDLQNCISDTYKGRKIRANQAEIFTHERLALVMHFLTA